MNKINGEVERAKFKYFFKETFRSHSNAEYREIFSRGLNDDDKGIHGAFPWLYIRVFFVLFLLFTVNTLILRLTDNKFYVPTVTFLGGITFTVPFIILLYELYPKRDISLFMLLSVLVGGGTAASALGQIIFMLVPVKNVWVSAVFTGFVEELVKIIPALLAIAITKHKNPYACFLIAAAVGAGFSVIEDMGYIFYYSDKYVFSFETDIQTTITVFLDRGLSAFCTHILWTGAVGWACSINSKAYRSLSLLVFAGSIGLHILWDFPLEGVGKGFIIAFCVIAAAAVNIAIVHKSRLKTLGSEVSLVKVNEGIIRQAKELGERMRFTNAANLTFSINVAVIAALVLVFCSLPIGMQYKKTEYRDIEDFKFFVQDELNLKYDTDRKFDVAGDNFETRYIEGNLSYVVQRQKYGTEGYEGVYFYGYYVSETFSPGTAFTEGYYISERPDTVFVELEGYPSRKPLEEYTFGGETVYLFTVNEDLKDYIYNKSDGSVTAITYAEEFTGYNFLTALCAAGVAVTVSCTVILTAFRIKLRRIKDER